MESFDKTAQVSIWDKEARLQRKPRTVHRAPERWSKVDAGRRDTRRRAKENEGFEWKAR